jgi:hypothetical protein
MCRAMLMAAEVSATWPPLNWARPYRYMVRPNRLADQLAVTLTVNSMTLAALSLVISGGLEF